MNEKRNIRDVFGADYLLAPPAPPLPPPTPSAAQHVAVPSDAKAFGAPAAATSLVEKAKEARRILQMRDILVRLQTFSGRSKLHVLLDQPTPMNIDLSELLAVVGDLEKDQLVRVIDKDRFGNWEVEITQAGGEFLTAMAL